MTSPWCCHRLVGNELLWRSYEWVALEEITINAQVAQGQVGLSRAPPLYTTPLAMPTEQAIAEHALGGRRGRRAGSTCRRRLGLVPPTTTASIYGSSMKAKAPFDGETSPALAPLSPALTATSEMSDTSSGDEMEREAMEMERDEMSALFVVAGVGAGEHGRRRGLVRELS